MRGRSRASGRPVQDNRSAQAEVLVDPEREKPSSEPNRETRRYRCPECGHNALDGTWKPKQYGGGMNAVWWCFGCGAKAPEISAAIGVGMQRLCYVWPPPEELGPVVRNGPIVPRIETTEGTIGGCLSALWTQEHEEARAYLSVVRGLTDETICECELGYDATSNAITLPVRDGNNALLGIKRRFLAADADPKAVNTFGLAALYPLAVFDDDPPAVVLCEGEFDALLLNQEGIDAVTPTTGTQGWDKHPEWAQWFRGRNVAVIYDAGSYELAAERASQLRRAGARRAWPVDLMLAGLKAGPPAEDITDWFVTYGKTADELRDLINRERRSCRRAHNTLTVDRPCSSEDWSARGRSSLTS